MYHSGIASLGRVKSSDFSKTRLFGYISEGKHKKVSSVLSNSEILVDDCNSRGQTALFVSCLLGHSKCVSVLLSFGANPNRRSDDASTPTHAAAFSCIPNILVEVVQHGGDLRLHDNRNLVPRDWAVEAGRKKNKKILQVIDQFYSDILANFHIQPSFTSFCPSLPRIFSKVAMKSTLACEIQTIHDKQLALNNCGYGHFVAVKYISECCLKGSNQVEVGHAALIPMIKLDQLSFAEASLMHECPPNFIMVNGKWGSQSVTVKEITPQQRKQRSIPCACPSDLLIHELNIVSLFRHQNILLLMGTCFANERNSKSRIESGQQLHLHSFVYESISHGSLYNILHTKKCHQINANWISMLIQVSSAISYLHQLGFIHCCITSHAIYMCSDQQAKLSDFYYTIHRNDMAPIPNQIYPIFNRWLAPELLVNKKPCFETDIYSYCVVVCETLSGILPWREFDPDSVRHQIVSRGHMLLVPPTVPQPLHEILRKGLSVSRSKRTTTIQEIDCVLKKLVKQQSNSFNDDYCPSVLTSTFYGSERVNRRSAGVDCGDLGIDQPDSYAFVQKKLHKIVEGTTLIAKESATPSHVEAFKKSTNNSNVDNGHQQSTHIQDIDGLKPSFSLSVSSPQQPYALDKAFKHTQKEWSHSGAEHDIFHNRDDSVGVIHCDLLDTDSSIIAESEECGSKRTDMCFSESVEVLETDEINRILNTNKRNHESEKLSSMEEGNKGRVQHYSNTTHDRTSPYPDLSDCKNSPGEYVLSGMSSQGKSLGNILDDERLSLSSTGSYLHTNCHVPIPVGAFTTSPPEIVNNVTEHMNIQQRKNFKSNENVSQSSLPPRPSSISCKAQDSPGIKSCHRYSKSRRQMCNEIKMTVDKSATTESSGSVPVESESPLHSSVQKVQKSLEEFSKLFKDEPTDANLPKNECLPKNLICEDGYQENSLTRNETSNFFEEVLSAAGLSQMNSGATSFSSEKKFKRKYQKSRRKKATKHARKYRPLAKKQANLKQLENQELCNKQADLKKQFDENVHPDENTTEPNKKKATHEKLEEQHVPSFSAHKASIPQPSADNVRHMTETSIPVDNWKKETDELSNEAKRSSVTSEDLIDIFADFAHRKGFLQVEESFQQDTCSLAEECNEKKICGIDKGPNVNCLQQSKCCNLAGTTMNEASQTNPIYSDNKMHKFDKISAQHPPTITEFLCRTGDWSFVAVPSNELQNCGNQITINEPLVMQNFPIPTNKTKTLTKSIQVCLPPVNFPAMKSSEVGSETPPAHDGHEHKDDATPSKWSFRKKLSVFEDKMGEKLSPAEVLVQSTILSAVKKSHEGAKDDSLMMTAGEKHTTPLYLTALEGEFSRSQLNETPTTTPVQMITRSGVKTSTPVLTKSLITDSESNENQANMQSTATSYQKLSSWNDKQEASPCTKVQKSLTYFPPSDMPESKLSPNVSVASPYMVDWSHESNDQSVGILNTQPKGTSLNLFINSETTSSSLSPDVIGFPKEVHIGIGELSQQITNSVLNEQMKKLQDDASEISFLETPEDVDKSQKISRMTCNQDTTLH